MKRNKILEYAIIFTALIVQGLRVPQSDVVDYLVFSNLVETLSFQQIAILVNKDFVFWSLLKILPFKGFWDLFVLEFISKIIIYECLRRKVGANMAFLWLFFPITISTSFHLIKQNLACAILFLALTTKDFKKLKWLSATSIHLSSGLFAPLFVRGKGLYLTGIIIVGTLIYIYIFPAPDYKTSIISWALFFFTIISLYKSKGFRKLSIYFLIVIGLFSFKGNYIGAIRIFYYLVPFLFLVLRGKKYFKGSSILFVIIVLIVINALFSPWEYSFNDNLFNFERSEYSLDVSYE